MIELKARQMADTDAMEVTIELGGRPSDVEEELEAILYNLYKRTWDKIGPEFMRRMCEATKNAMGRIFVEVVKNGKL